MKILIIIPAYNEQDSIERVVGQIRDVCPEMDYLVVNDCSTDSTRAILRTNNMEHVSLSVNLGIGGGVQTGYMYAYENNYDIAIQFDGDGQHNADYIANLVAPLIAGDSDMVIGSRYMAKDKKGFQSTGMRRLGSGILRGAIRISTGRTIYDATSGFRAVNRDLTAYYADHYAQDYPEPEAIVAALLNGYRVAEMPVVMNERTSGRSSISPIKSVYYMLKVTLAILLKRILHLN